MVTMKDIAAGAGVSQATVSYVLNERNDGIRIREETRRKILEVAAELGYRRNDLARAMVTGRNFVFGFLTRNASAEGASRILVGAHEEASRSGYMVKLLPLGQTENPEEAICRSMEQRLAGIVAQNLGPQALEILRREAAGAGVPVILTDDSPAQEWGVRVVSDDLGGIRQALRHLVEKGHERIGFVGAQANSQLGRQRLQFFHQAMAELGRTPEEAWGLATDWQKAEVIEPRVTALLQSPAGRPTALLCAGDMIAMATLRAARAAGLRLPDQLSVVGFADLLMASYADPALTTVAQPFEEMGRIAVRHLLCCASGREIPPVRILTAATNLVVRASVSSPEYN